MRTIQLKYLKTGNGSSYQTLLFLNLAKRWIKARILELHTITYVRSMSNGALSICLLLRKSFSKTKSWNAIEFEKETY